MAKSTKTHRRRRSTASHRPRRRHNRAPKHFMRKHRRRNPVFSIYPVRRKRRGSVKRYAKRRHNPKRAGGSQLTGYLMKAAQVGVGAVGSRVLTQFAFAMLKQPNSGVAGYAGNVGATLALGWGAGKFFGRSARNYVLIGGGLGLLLRVINDMTPWGKQLNLAGIDGGVGALMPSEYLSPAIYTGNGAERRVPASLRPQPVAAKGMGAYRGADRYSAARR